jgi:hypothetical protein
VLAAVTRYAMAIELNKIERAEHSRAVVLPVAEQIKDRQPTMIADDRLAVYEA